MKFKRPAVRLRRPVNAADAERRQQIIDLGRLIRAEIQQIFVDAAHWNEHVRQPHEEPVDPDPDGRLQRCLDYIDAVVAGEGMH